MTTKTKDLSDIPERVATLESKVYSLELWQREQNGALQEIKKHLGQLNLKTVAIQTRDETEDEMKIRNRNNAHHNREWWFLVVAILGVAAAILGNLP